MSRSMKRVAVVAALVVSTVMGTSSIVSANKEGGACKRAGTKTGIPGGTLVCTRVASGKNKVKLVWTRMSSGSGSGSSGSSSGGSSGTSGAITTTTTTTTVPRVTSVADIPKVIQNWGLAVAPYDSATGKAGVLAIRGVIPPSFGNSRDDSLYKHIVSLYGATIREGTREPQPVWVAPLGTQVISMVDGTVCEVSSVWSGDFSIRVSPTGIPCSVGLRFEHEHVINPSVRVGDTVKAGQAIALVSDYNSHWRNKGLGILDIGVHFGKSDNLPYKACPSVVLSPDKRDELLATMRSVQTAWMAERNDNSLYDLSAQNPIGCLTSDEIQG